MASASDILGDRWVLLILRSALYGVSRFGDLQAELRIARGVLSDRLERLIASGLLVRSTYRDEGDRARDEYRPTPAARDLLLTFAALQQWGDTWLRGAAPRVRPISALTGEPLHVAFATTNGREHPADKVLMG